MGYTKNMMKMRNTTFWSENLKGRVFERYVQKGKHNMQNNLTCQHFLFLITNLQMKPLIRCYGWKMDGWQEKLATMKASLNHK
jgi:hypothetical protein